MTFNKVTVGTTFESRLGGHRFIITRKNAKSVYIFYLNMKTRESEFGRVRKESWNQTYTEMAVIRGDQHLFIRSIFQS